MNLTPRYKPDGDHKKWGAKCLTLLGENGGLPGSEFEE